MTKTQPVAPDCLKLGLSLARVHSRKTWPINSANAARWWHLQVASVHSAACSRSFKIFIVSHYIAALNNNGACIDTLPTPLDRDLGRGNFRPNLGSALLAGLNLSSEKLNGACGREFAAKVSGEWVNPRWNVTRWQLIWRIWWRNCGAFLMLKEFQNNNTVGLLQVQPCDWQMLTYFIACIDS